MEEEKKNNAELGETRETEPIEPDGSEQDTTMGLLKEFVEFLGERKKYWLLPIIIVLVLLGALIVFTSTSAVAPFIYAIF